MKQEEKNKILELRASGLTYNEIAIDLEISKNTFASFLKRITKGNKVLKGNCVNCDLSIDILRNKKEKKFCDDKCRMQWWNKNKDKVNKKAFYSIECKQYLKIFQSYGNKNRKYCCVNCFNSYRTKGGKCE